MSYCLKCRKKTDDVGAKRVTSGNRSYLKSTCAVCGSKKSKAVAKQAGGCAPCEMGLKPPCKVGGKIIPRGSLKKGPGKMPPKTVFAEGGPQLSPAVMGAGVINNVLNSGYLPELHLIGRNEKTGKIQRHSFTGPGTKLDKRLDKSGKPLAHSLPINRVDEAALEHDKCYNKIKDTSGRNVCDRTMVASLNKVIEDPATHWLNNAEAHVVKFAINSKQKLGMGRKKPRGKGR